MEDYKDGNKPRFIYNVLENEAIHRFDDDPRVRSFVTPKAVLWKTHAEKARVENAEVLLERRAGQIGLNANQPCILRNCGEMAAILLDFGLELQGGIQILAWRCGGGTKNARLRIRFGESAMEAMSEIGGEKGATNNHAVRDMEIEASYLGMTEAGKTGFRFVRIDLLDEDSYIEIKSVRAVFEYKDIEYKGSFRCSDALLTQIWNTGAYTVHLNMQNYMWDGIKRDRLVWVGDMHPETSTIQAVFGYDDAVPKSLDFIRDETPLPGWMNGIPTYSMWWILVHYSWYMYNGTLAYLHQQKEYLVSLLNQLLGCIGEDGRSLTPEVRFIDWPSSENPQAVEAGIHSLMILALEAGAKLCKTLEEMTAAAGCSEGVAKLRQFRPDENGSKQAAALMVLAGLADKTEVNDTILSKGGAKNISTFLGYYVLIARGLAGDIKGALDCIRQYWGGMLKLGATTFWEDFNIDWLENAAGIDQMAKDGKRDVHGEYGAYCYKGYRNSLCHGWAAGPTAWLSEYVLGVSVEEAGCKTVRIRPQLGDLSWAEGSFPTPQGIIYMRHEKKEDGSLKSRIDVPKGIKIIS